MTKLSSLVLLTSLAILGGCAQLDSGNPSVPERDNPAYLKGVDTRSDELYIKVDGPVGARDFRDVFIAPADLASLQIIQPEGAAPDDEWAVDESENKIIQKAFGKEFTQALGFQSAYNIVDNREAAEIIVKAVVVAIHPNETRAEVEAGAKPSGAITISIALVDAQSGAVMVRSVDTKSTDDIWAFNQAESDDEAINAIFRSWGNSIRRGMLHVQGRSSDPLAPSLNVKEQR
jgi:hypothetical protein